ncbi:MAG: CaiB/BaiF CoA transferase family protein [Hyphomicrobiaceae bacterium]
MLIQPLLRGVRILELGHFIAGPFCTRVLADLGADVIKAEPPDTGDPMRTWGEMVEGKSLWWSAHARNKRSVTLDIRHREAPKLILRLAAKCDAVVENYKPGQLEKWGLTKEAFATARPGIVLVRISGYGQTGPEAGQAGFGVIGEAKGGLRHLCAHPQESSDLPPIRIGISIGDSIAALYGAIGLLAAVLESRAEGAKDARVIDVALGEAVLSLLEGVLPEYGYLGRVRQPQGSRMATASPSNAYRANDGSWVLIAANSDPLFKLLAQVMDRPELAGDARFLDNQSRLRHNTELDRLIGAWVGRRTAEETIALLDEVNIPASKIYTAADIAADRQYRARKMVTEVADPRFGTLLHPGVVPVVEGLDRDAQIRWPGPELGRHNAEVYGDLLGCSAAEIAEQSERKII